MICFGTGKHTKIMNITTPCSAIKMSKNASGDGAVDVPVNDAAKKEIISKTVHNVITVYKNAVLFALKIRIRVCPSINCWCRGPPRRYLKSILTIAICLDTIHSLCDGAPSSVSCPNGSLMVACLSIAPVYSHTIRSMRSSTVQSLWSKRWRLAE